MASVSGAAIGSRAFGRLWNRPALVDHLIAIWEAREENQKERDRMAEVSGYLLDAIATDQRNIHRSAETQPFTSIKDQLEGKRPNTARAREDEEDEFTRKIAEAEQLRRSKKLKQ